MKPRTLLYILLLFACLPACKKAANSSAPGSTTNYNPANNTNQFQLTFGGRTYGATSTFSVSATGSIYDITPANYTLQASISAFYSPAHSLLYSLSCDIPGKFQCNLTALHLTDTSEPGTYTVQNSYYFLDSTSGYTVYTMDSTSALTITAADSNWITGTMNFDMINNSGTHFPATGSFHITARN
jgi:hypothetical protein